MSGVRRLLFSLALLLSLASGQSSAAPIERLQGDTTEQQQRQTQQQANFKSLEIVMAERDQIPRGEPDPVQTFTRPGVQRGGGAGFAGSSQQGSQAGQNLRQMHAAPGTIQSANTGGLERWVFSKEKPVRGEGGNIFASPQGTTAMTTNKERKRWKNMQAIKGGNHKMMINQKKKHWQPMMWKKMTKSMGTKWQMMNQIRKRWVPMKSMKLGKKKHGQWKWNGKGKWKGK